MLNKQFVQRSAILRCFLFLSMLFLLGACGTTVIIQFPDSPTAQPTVTATASPTATTTRVSSPTATVTSAPSATKSSTPSAMTALTLANLNLRAGPSTTYTVLRVIPINSTVQLVGRNGDGSWLKIPDGWISSQFVQTSGNIQNLPVIPAPEPTPTREIGTRISYNINGEAIPDKTYLTAHLQRLCPSTVLIMNNLGYAVELYNLLHGPCKTIVISRSWSALEGDEWFYRSAEDFVSQWRREGHPEIVRYSANEPSFGGTHSTGEFVNAEVQLMRMAREAGFTVAMGNFSVGYIQQFSITSGSFDPYLRALNQYGHYLAVHEYSVVALPFGVGQWPVDALLDRQRVQSELWPQASSLPTRLVNGQLPPYWYLRRADWFLLRADQLGIQRPKILVTEYGWDNLPNIKAYIEPLRQQFGLDRYMRDMRGVNTYQALWRWYWPQWSFADAACKQLQWTESVYPAEYIGFNLFTWSTHPHWLQTDMSGRENPSQYELHRCLENYAASSN
jgi:uncharacterized protein YraI